MRKWTAAALAVLALGAGALWILTAPQTVAAEALGPHAPDLANGKTLFDAGGCAPCHATPEQDDRTLLGGGRALKTPFGTFFAPNVSSDVRDGIGGWSEAQFVTAMHHGVSPGGQHLYPAFPYTSYAHMPFDDVRDLFAYLKTLPAVSGRAPPHELSFPFTLRRGIGLWKRLFLDRTTFTPTPSRSAQWNRGAYLVDAVAHCAECHSPRNAFGAIIERQRFAGGPDVDGEGWVGNITQQRLGDWTVDDLTTLLDSGMTPEGDFVGSTMADVTADTALLSDADRLAIATYVKALAPVDGPPRPQKSSGAAP